MGSIWEKLPATLEVSSHTAIPLCQRWEWVAFQLHVKGGADLSKSSNCLRIWRCWANKETDDERRLGQLLVTVF